MKRILVFAVILCLLLSLRVFAAQENDGGLLPLEKAIFSGISTPADAGWSAGNGTLTVEKTGGYSGNNYLQLLLEEGKGATLSFDASEYLASGQSYTLSFYMRLSGFSGAKEISLPVRCGGASFATAAQRVEPNRWTLFSVAFAGTGVIEVDIPAGQTKVCIDAVKLNKGASAATVVPGETNTTETQSVTVKKNAFSASTVRAIVIASVCGLVGIGIAAVILFLPERFVPPFIRALPFFKKKNKT